MISAGSLSFTQKLQYENSGTYNPKKNHRQKYWTNKTDIETGATVVVGGLRSLARSIWIPFYTVSRWTTSFSTIPFQDRKKSVLILFYDRWNIVCSDQALDDPFEQSFCSITERLYWPIQFPIVEWSSSTIPFEDRWMIVSSTDHFLRSLKDRIYQTLCVLWSLHDPNH